VPWTADDWAVIATGLDVLALTVDLAAAGVVVYGTAAGVGIPIAFGATAPIAPVTGVGAFFLAQLYVQPILVIGDWISLAGTGATIVSETKAGNTVIETGNLSYSTWKSIIFTVGGFACRDAFTSVIIQSGAVASDFGVSFPLPNQ
jgi:hypothetical protein